MGKIGKFRRQNAAELISLKSQYLWRRKNLEDCSRVKETKKTKIQCVILDSSSKDKVIKDISGTAGKM